eukprot:scaffold26695_cov71-Cyclotella_meneghiniana.AAC.12
MTEEQHLLSPNNNYGTTSPTTSPPPSIRRSVYDPSSPRRFHRSSSIAHSIRDDIKDIQHSPLSVSIDTSHVHHSKEALDAANVILERRSTLIRKPLPLFDVVTSSSSDEELAEIHSQHDRGKDLNNACDHKPKPTSILAKVASQIPAVAIVSLLNFMMGIPFGASYFPVEWANSGSEHGVHIKGEFPLPGKEALGLRMFLFSSIMAQLTYTFASKFTNGVGLQMVENVPFCLELARIVIREQGYGMDALSTLFFLFGISSVIVGALEVSTSVTFHFTAEGAKHCVVDHFHLLAPVLAFEIVLRMLLHATDYKYPLLAPTYYCAITPLFYLMLWTLNFDFDAASNAGIIDLPSISWVAVVKSVPTMVSLTAFSLIHVPINIPAFSISTNVDPDMNAELIAHGYSNTLSGVFESYDEYDRLEYAGIWLITIVMVSIGMDAALIAGVIAALSTYAAQSIAYQYPIRGAMTAARLRSSAWNRSSEAEKILMDPVSGRQRIFVIQMQGHIFFGNATTMVDDINQLLKEKHGTKSQPIAVLLDFSPVLGMDSSAAQAIAKLNNSIRNNFDVEIVIFVSGSEDGFPCDYDLSEKVDEDVTNRRKSSRQLLQPDLCPDDSMIVEGSNDDVNLSDSLEARIIQYRERSKSSVIATIPNSRVCASLDDALIFAEDVCLALIDTNILQNDVNERHLSVPSSLSSLSRTIEEDGAKMILTTLCRGATPSDIETLFSLLIRETYGFDDVIWNQGDPSDCMKLLVDGTLISLLEDEHGATETICPGSTIGELGLVNDSYRFTTVKVLSDEAVLYTLTKERWAKLTLDSPRIARFIDLLVVRYLSHRVQHVSNHILDRRSLPV